MIELIISFSFVLVLILLCCLLNDLYRKIDYLEEIASNANKNALMVKNSLEYYKTSGEDQYFETGRFKVLDDLYEYLEIEREDLQKTKFTKITKK